MPTYYYPEPFTKKRRGEDRKESSPPRGEKGWHRFIDGRGEGGPLVPPRHKEEGK